MSFMITCWWSSCWFSSGITRHLSLSSGMVKNIDQSWEHIVPGSIVLRFFLYPHYLSIFIFFNLWDNIFEWEGCQLFNSYYCNIVLAFLNSGFVQVIVNLTCAENKSFHFLRSYNILIWIWYNSSEPKSFSKILNVRGCLLESE